MDILVKSHLFKFILKTWISRGVLYFVNTLIGVRNIIFTELSSSFYPVKLKV